MSQTLELDSAMQAAPRPGAVRRQLVKRLADAICLPASKLTPQERHMAGDVLVELLRSTEADIRESVAKRLVMLNEAPRTILLILAKDEIRIARHVLENSKSLTDSDLIQIARQVKLHHRKEIAQRRHLSDAVADVLVEFMEEDVVETLLKNRDANLSDTALQRILVASRAHQTYVELLARRDELRPSHGLTMFWWADTANRRRILKRFAVTRHVLQDSCADLYALAAAEGWNDSGVRKALQFIERRQRNRVAVQRSPYDGLEAAIEDIRRTGLTRTAMEEIAYMAGIKPATGAQILTDAGGEPIAVFCKAPGLSREHLEAFWIALGRPTQADDGTPAPALARAMETYDTISTDKAQTVLRYWNWSLTASLGPEVLDYIRKGVIPREEEFGAAAITAALVFSHKG
ncbi:DUF2336 domain-containing protein [uncultured Algimonas sp.]|uniref:DUF2336 domain-containing protein n=1 Tax=uncultured Algimonas sp. TaxID=1547920 RepID=UPI00262C33C6|nr:DUF2336 domain-containing protein [uncultured Algimonas sp.]